MYLFLRQEKKNRITDVVQENNGITTPNFCKTLIK
jgi:hypothetical protein